MADYSDLEKLTFRLELPGGQRRLKEAALYVMEAARDFDHFGLIKLNKMLWRADFRSFLERKFPVTGRPYQKLEFGPAPVEMRPILRDLEADGCIRYIESSIPNEQRPEVIAPISRANLSPIDTGYLDEAIEYYRHMTGMATSKDSHGVAWRTRNIGDQIPYNAAIFDDSPLSQEMEHKLHWLGRDKKWQSA